MTPHEKVVLTEALQAAAEQKREAMRQQEQAFGAVVCLVCLIIISCVIIGAGFRSVSQMIDAAKQAEVRRSKHALSYRCPRPRERRSRISVSMQ